MLIYAAVFAIGFAGLLQAPWWAAVVGGCLLALMFIAEDHHSQDRGGGNTMWVPAQTMSSLIISITAAPIAFGAGRVAATMWGL